MRGEGLEGRTEFIAVGFGLRHPGVDPHAVGQVQKRHSLRNLGGWSARRPGDRFQPLGTSDLRSLKKYLIARRTPRHMRDQTPLVTAGDDRIVWIVGQTIGAEFALSDAPVPVLHLRAVETKSSSQG